ncbi:MAG: DoxX family protein [Bacteroidota bacterium]
MSNSSFINNTFRNLLSSQSWSVDLALLLVRIACAFMILHGWGKFTDFSDGVADWPDPFHVGPVASKGLTVFAELFCAIFVVIGLFTRFALIPLIICMVVIVFVVHSGDPLGDKESGLIYLLMYLTLFLAGPGQYSVDRLMRKG